MTVTNAGSLLAEASACRWSQLVFAKRWNELREERLTSDSELLNAFWSVVVLKQHPPVSPSPPSPFDADLSFLDELELEIDKELVASFVCFLIASGQLAPEAVWEFVSDHGGLTKQEYGKLQIELLGDLLKSLVISLLSLSHETNHASQEVGTVQKGDQVLVAKFKLLLSIESSLIASICDFLATHWDFNNQLTCLRLSKWLDVVSIFERSGPLKVFCQFSTPKTAAIIDSWRRLQQLALSMAALDRSAIQIKDHLITMSHRWISRSRMTPFFTHTHPSPSKGIVTNTGGSSGNDLANEPDFCSLFCGAVDYLYALEFGSNINRFSSSEFVIPLLRSLSLSMTLFVAPSNSESAISQQLLARYVPLLNHLATSMGIQITNLFELIEHAVKTAVHQPATNQSTPNQSPASKKYTVTNFVDSRPNYLLRVFQSCRLSCLAKHLGVTSYNGQFISELITNAGRDMTRTEFEEYVGRDLLKNLHIAPFLNRTEITRLQLVLGERAAKEENHLALGLLAAVDLFKCYLITGPGIDRSGNGAIISEGAVGSFLENIINKRIRNFSNLILTTEDDDGCDHHQDDNDGHLPDLDTFMSTLPDSVAESVGIGLETASRLLFLLGKTDSARVANVVRRLVFANPTLAFILWLLVDEKLRRRQMTSFKRDRNQSNGSSSDSPAPKRRKSESSIETLLSVNETLKTNINMLKSPFNGVYSLLLTLSAQVRCLAVVNRGSLSNTQSRASPSNANSDPVYLALKHPGLLNHYLVMRDVALPDGAFKSGEATAQPLGLLFTQVIASGSNSHLNNGNSLPNTGFTVGVDTSEGYRNFLAFALPLIAGLDAETLRHLFRKWFATSDGFLASTFLSTGCQLSFIVAAQVWNFSFFLILLTMSSSSLPAEEVKQIVGRFFTDWHLGLISNNGLEASFKKERFRFVAVEMFFAELMFFANISVCRLVVSSLPTGFILNFVTSTAPPSGKFTSSVSSLLHSASVTTLAPSNRLLQLKRRVIGRLFALDENNRFDEDFCIRAVCSLSPFESV